MNDLRIVKVWSEVMGIASPRQIITFSILAAGWVDEFFRRHYAIMLKKGGDRGQKKMNMEEKHKSYQEVKP